MVGGGPRFSASRSNELDRADGGLAAARIGLGVELHLLAFAKTLDASALERGGVDEHVLLAVVRLDEAEALLVVVELDGTVGHCSAFRLRVHVGCGARLSWPSSHFVDFGERLKRAPANDEAKRPSSPANIDGGK